VKKKLLHFREKPSKSLLTMIKLFFPPTIKLHSEKNIVIHNWTILYDNLIRIRKKFLTLKKRGKRQKNRLFVSQKIRINKKGNLEQSERKQNNNIFPLCEYFSDLHLVINNKSYKLILKWQPQFLAVLQLYYIKKSSLKMINTLLFLFFL